LYLNDRNGINYYQLTKPDIKSDQSAHVIAGNSGISNVMCNVRKLNKMKTISGSVWMKS
jgi:hypothetical protein